MTTQSTPNGLGLFFFFLPGHPTAEDGLIFQFPDKKSTGRALTNGFDPALNTIYFPRLSETVVNEF